MSYFNLLLFQATLYYQGFPIPFALPVGPYLPYQTPGITAWSVLPEIASRIAQEDQGKMLIINWTGLDCCRWWWSCFEQRIGQHSIQRSLTALLFHDFMTALVFGLVPGKRAAIIHNVFSPTCGSLSCHLQLLTFLAVLFWRTMIILTFPKRIAFSTARSLFSSSFTGFCQKGLQLYMAEILSVGSVPYSL